MFQVGKASTLDQTNVLDFGLAPSVKLGIGTPTEITLSAILQHRKDQVPYGVPNLNGFPINVPRNTAYGFDATTTVQDVIPLNSTIDHKFAANLSLRNQTEFVWVNTAVRETSGGFVGTLAANGGFVQAAAGPGNTPYSAAPLNQLYVRQLSRDRNINDYTLENQTEMTAKFDTGLRRPYAADGPRPQLRGLHQQDLYPYRRLQRHPPGGGLSAAAWPRASRPAATRRPTFPACRATMRRRRRGAWACMPTIPPGDAVAQARRRRALGRLFGADRQFDQFGQHARQYDSSLSRRRPTTSPAFAPARSSSRRGSNPTTSPTAPRSIRRSSSSPRRRARPPLPPETNEGFEAGVKYELFNGNLSLNGALFQITKNNARTANADGTFTPTGTVRVQGARVGVAGQITARLAGVRRLRLSERPHHQRHRHRRRRQHHGQRAAQHAAATRPTSGRPTRSTTPTRSAAASSMSASATPTTPTRCRCRSTPAFDADGGLQAADVRRPPQRLQRLQHDVLRRADGVGRRSRRPGLGHDRPCSR